MRIVCSPTPESLRIFSVFVVFAMAAVADRGARPDVAAGFQTA